FDNYTLGEASIDITSYGPDVIEGQYSVVLQPGFDPFGSGKNVGASISQTGLVPANARSLQFKAYDYQGSYPAPVFSVSLAGQNLALVTLGTGSNYTLYGADISAFAGQVGALTIATSAQPNRDPYYFDSFIFSPSSVPEPSVMSLAIICIIFCCWCRTRSNNARACVKSPAEGAIQVPTTHAPILTLSFGGTWLPFPPVEPGHLVNLLPQPQPGIRHQTFPHLSLHKRWADQCNAVLLL